MKLHELQTGDIIAIAGYTWLAKRIQHFMKVQARKKYKTKLPRYYNHTMTVTEPTNININEATPEWFVDKNINLEVAEAVAKGFVNHRFFDNYKRSDLKNMMIFRLHDGLDLCEKGDIIEYVKELEDKNIKYEVFNFFWWAVYIYSNGRIDWSPKGSMAKKKLFCFETSCELINKAIPLFKKPSLITTVDLQMDKRFGKYYFD